MRLNNFEDWLIARDLLSLDKNEAFFLHLRCKRLPGSQIKARFLEEMGFKITDNHLRVWTKNVRKAVNAAKMVDIQNSPDICRVFHEIAGDPPDLKNWPPTLPPAPPTSVVFIPPAEVEPSVTHPSESPIGETPVAQPFEGPTAQPSDTQPTGIPEVGENRRFWLRDFDRRQIMVAVIVALIGLAFVAFMIFGNGPEPPGGDPFIVDATGEGAVGQVTPGDSPTEEPQPQETPAASPVVLPSTTNTRQPTETPTITLTPSITPTPTDTSTPTSTSTPTVTPTPTNTPTPSATPLSVASSWANDRVALSIASHEFNAFDVKGVIGYRFAVLFTFRYENFSGETISLRFNGENFRLIDDSGVSYVCRASIGGHYQEQEQMTLNVPSGGKVEFNIGCGKDEVFGQGVLSAYLITTDFSSLGESRWHIEVPG